MNANRDKKIEFAVIPPGLYRHKAGIPLHFFQWA